MPSSGARRANSHAEARAAIRQRRYTAALTLLKKSLRETPDDVDALCLSALAEWRAHGDFAAARAHLARALELRPDDADVLTLCAEFALHFGEIDRVFALTERALAIDPGRTAAMVAMARADAGRISDDTLRTMIVLANGGKLPQGRWRHLLNAVGRALDARGRYDEAFDYFSRSNRLASGPYDAAAEEARLAAAHALFTPAFFADRAQYGLRGSGCVFIVGPPRTGSTLIEQTLAAHPGVESCGESDALRAIDFALRRDHAGDAVAAEPYAHVAATKLATAARAAEAYLAATAKQMALRGKNDVLLARIDKKLSNFYHAGLIRLMLPDATLLWVRRHPLDVCLSCFSQGFEGHFYANDLRAMAHFYMIQHSYMRLWSGLFPEQTITLSYEDHVAAPERGARRLLARLGLPWDDSCLSPHHSDRFVQSSSAAQVKAPAHSRAVSRWRHYEERLQPLIRAFGGMGKIEALRAA